jgi:hypothetical protein
MADAFHYPPDIFDLLVNTIPLLSRGKKGVILFLRGAGVTEEDLAEVSLVVNTNPAEPNKFEIVRQVLTKLNARGDSGLRPRREIIKRVSEFESFESCWPADQYKAKGLVASVREAVNAKDSFTRMKQERDAEREQEMTRQRAEQTAASQKRSKMPISTLDWLRFLEWIINRKHAANYLRPPTPPAALGEKRSDAAKNPITHLRWSVRRYREKPG